MKRLAALVLLALAIPAVVVFRRRRTVESYESWADFIAADPYLERFR